MSILGYDRSKTKLEYLSTSTMEKLWRILYSPRGVFDELNIDTQTSIPLVAVLATVALSSLIQSNPVSMITNPLGWLIAIAGIGTGFFIVGKICGTHHSWTQWFGFASWIHVPLILSMALDALLAVLNVEWPRFELFTRGELRSGIELGFPFWLWIYVISVLGLRSWTSKGTGACIGFALLPPILLALPLFMVFYALYAAFSALASLI